MATKPKAATEESRMYLFEDDDKFEGFEGKRGEGSSFMVFTVSNHRNIE